MNQIKIRPATLNDVPEINNILNNAILNTTYNLKEQARPINEAEDWFKTHTEEGYPIIVAEIDNAVAGHLFHIFVIFQAMILLLKFQYMFLVLIVTKV